MQAFETTRSILMKIKNYEWLKCPSTCSLCKISLNQSLGRKHISNRISHILHSFITVRAIFTFLNYILIIALYLSKTLSKQGR